MKWKTVKEIQYCCAYYKTMVIPKNTPVIPATNLPEPDLYWCEEWPGMNEYEQSWHRNYGFLIKQNEIW